MKKNKRLVRDLKNAKKNAKTLREFAIEKYVNEEGIAVINVEINEDNLYEEYSLDNDKKLANSLFEYIENEAYYIPFEFELQIAFHSNFDIDEEILINKFKDHYSKKMIDKRDDLKTNRFISSSLFAVGVLFLIIYFIISYNPDANILFSEVFSIIASFAVWESVDYFIISRNELKIEFLNIIQLANANVKVIKKDVTK